MKKSELRSLIREEIMKVIESQPTAAGPQAYGQNTRKSEFEKKPKKAKTKTAPQAHIQNTRKREFGK